MSAHERECQPEKTNVGQGSVSVDPGPTYVSRDINMPARTHQCQSGEAARGRICRPGNVDVDPRQPNAGPGELMSAQEADEDLKCSKAMLMSSPRADEEDPVRM
jgi:hypothetical protein